MSTPYYRIWRPGMPGSCCVDYRYAQDFQELCGQYAALENRLRLLLAKRGVTPMALGGGGRQVFRLLREIRYEIDYQFEVILRANRAAKQGRYRYGDYIRLEACLRLSEYEVALPPGCGEPLRPFAGWTRQEPSWYAGSYPLVLLGRPPREATLHKAMLATAGLRCLLYAQFGASLDEALAPCQGKSQGEGLFTARSIFPLVPPAFSQEELYDDLPPKVGRGGAGYRAFFGEGA